MDDPTSLLFGLDGFVVLDVEGVGVERATVRVVVETETAESACPSCGVLSSRVKDRPLCRIKDLPASGQVVQLWWRKRRLVCLAERCPRGSFVERDEQVPFRSRLTTRLRSRLGTAITGSNRAVADVAGEYGVGWHTAHRALVGLAASVLPEPAPTAVLGVDETRARSLRWVLERDGWKRSDPWLTSFVDADPTRPGCLLGLAPGRSGGCVKAWFAEQTSEFRNAVQVVVIDPSAPYASGIRAALPHAQIAVDHWHLVRLANDMVTDVRQRVAREHLGRRGRKVDPAWAHRRMLLSAGDRLTPAQLARLDRVLATDDPTDEIGAAWAVKELLRQLLAERDPTASDIGCGASTTTPPACRCPGPLASPRPSRRGGPTSRYSSTSASPTPAPKASTGSSQTKRVACGFRNLDNYQRRILTHIAITRPRPAAA